LQIRLIETGKKILLHAELHVASAVAHTLVRSEHCAAKQVSLLTFITFCIPMREATSGHWNKACN